LATRRAPPYTWGSIGPETYWASGSSDPGATTAATSVTATAAADPRAHPRQREDGGDPVGVSSRTNPTTARHAAIAAG
jgi:hypothetical protein